MQNSAGGFRMSQGLNGMIIGPKGPGCQFFPVTGGTDAKNIQDYPFLSVFTETVQQALFQNGNRVPFVAGIKGINNIPFGIRQNKFGGG